MAGCPKYAKMSKAKGNKQEEEEEEEGNI